MKRVAPTVGSRESRGVGAKCLLRTHLVQASEPGGRVAHIELTQLASESVLPTDMCAGQPGLGDPSVWTLFLGQFRSRQAEHLNLCNFCNFQPNVLYQSLLLILHPEHCWRNSCLTRTACGSQRKARSPPPPSRGV